MSIENQLAALTAAVIELTNALKGGSQSTVTVTSAPAPAPAPAAPAVQMPPPPVFTAPAFAPPVAAAPVGAPFTDGAGLIGYVMESYKAMGPAKGAQIQGVLTSLGYGNINDVKAEHYAALYQGVEALKKS